MEIKCIKCKKEKNISEFSRNLKKKDGINKICKECHSEYRKIYYVKNKLKELSKVREYQINNPERYKNNDKKAGRVVKSKCPVCNSDVLITKKDNLLSRVRYCSKSCRNTLRQSCYKVYLTSIKKRSLKLKKEFDLDELFIKELLEIKQCGRCAITNIPLILKDKRDTKDSFLDNASLDRIDSKKGYTKDNVQWLALGINYMKLDFEESELHRILKLVKENYTSVA